MLYQDPDDTNQLQPSDPRVQPGYVYAPQPVQPGAPLPVTPGPIPVVNAAQPPVSPAAQPQAGQAPSAPTGALPAYTPVPQGQLGQAQPLPAPTGTLPPYPPVYMVPQPGQAQALPTLTGTLPAARHAKPARSKARTATLFALTCVIALVFGVGLFSGWSFARSSANTASPLTSGTTSPSATISTALDNQAAREAAIAKVSPAVVEILGQTNQGTALGSGVIVDKNGDIVTNAHVVDGTSELRVVLGNGKQVAAQLVGVLTTNDLAVVRIQPYTGMVVATLGDSSKLTIGQEVLAIGNPLGYSGTVTSGVVSALQRSAQESQSVDLTGLIQTSAAINPGNSGGALIDLQGEVVGIPTLTAIDNETNTPANGIGFAIPSNQVKAALQQILG